MKQKKSIKDSRHQRHEETVKWLHWRGIVMGSMRSVAHNSYPLVHCRKGISILFNTPYSVQLIAWSVDKWFDKPSPDKLSHFQTELLRVSHWCCNRLILNEAGEKYQRLKTSKTLRDCKVTSLNWCITVVWLPGGVNP